jgi:hypothetical protein
MKQKRVTDALTAQYCLEGKKNPHPKALSIREKGL